MLNASSACALVSGMIFSFAIAQGQVASTTGVTLSHHTSAFLRSATNLGPANASQTADVTVWLRLHNRASLDQLAAALYNPDSQLYHAWLTKDVFRQNYAPSEQERKTVESFLSSRGLQIVSSDPYNLSVRARGSVGSLAAAFRVNINSYSLNGETYYANANDPTIVGAAASLVRSVSGLDNFAYQHHLLVQGGNLKRGNGLSAFTALASGAVATTPADAFSTCFGSGSVSETFTSPGYPMATYTGLGYGSATSSGCGYTPAQIQAAYNLDKLYAKGFDGSGQTIVIIDWCGSPTILDDANAFSAEFGLPPLTSSNFNIINYPTASACAARDVEINLDVEWAHAIAPGAKITLLVPPTASFQDTDVAQLFAEVEGLGSVISGSYGAEELRISPAELDNQNLIAEVGATFGIAVNFSTGDSGDFTADAPTVNPASVSAPASGPFATAIGGVTLALNSDNSIRFQTGWGNNHTLLREDGFVYNPPIHLGFYGGSGGGASGFYPKPAFQGKLPGSMRQLPDVSWLADPFTGAIVLVSAPFVFPPQQYGIVGGTSLSCPMFSALWAIANQVAGQRLGQAAPYLYSAPSSAFFDIVPYSSPLDVTGIISTSPTLSLTYSAASLAQPLVNVTTFLSAIWNYPALAIGETNYLLTFGTDTSLNTAVGWDNVTGLGVPNVGAFADSLTAPPVVR